MSYLIDGSNLIGHLTGQVRDANEKYELARKLWKFQRQTRARVTLTFDGPPDPRLDAPPPPAGARTLSVLYPAIGEKADGLIRDILFKQKDGRRVVLVTSDRELASLGRERGARVLGCAGFAKLLRRTVKDYHEARASHKRETAPPGGLELRLWMDVFKGNR